MNNLMVKENKLSSFYTEDELIAFIEGKKGSLDTGKEDGEIAKPGKEELEKAGGKSNKKDKDAGSLSIGQTNYWNHVIDLLVEAIASIPDMSLSKAELVSVWIEKKVEESGMTSSSGFGNKFKSKIRKKLGKKNADK